MSSLLKLVQVSKKYQMDGVSVEALKNVNLAINKGELTSIVGPSGSGKSTLMHIIGCLDRPTSGEYYFDEKKLSQLNDQQLAQIRNKKIGFVFQTFNLLPRVSALHNVELPLFYSNLGSRERHRLALEKLEAVGLAERIEHHPNQLSGGQQQRVAIARALVNRPDLILADEPTGNLDTKSGKEILDLLFDLNKKGNTIVIVTHDLEIAKKCKRIIKIRDGEIIDAD
jgi:putative ABC transport system ATP-binding protein